jgi:hypothetical protein
MDNEIHEHVGRGVLGRMEHPRITGLARMDMIEEALAGMLKS